MKLKTLLFLCLCLFAGINIEAYDAEIDVIYYDFSGDEAYVTYKAMPPTSNKEAYSGSITIPDEVIYNDKTYSVTRIGNSAFQGCSNLSSVIIPNSVVFINPYAFESCSSLTSIDIPGSVMLINTSAFENCSNLTSATIGEGVSIIRDYAFSCCSNLTSINIPESVTSVGERAFQYCI